MKTKQEVLQWVKVFEDRLTELIGSGSYLTDETKRCLKCLKDANKMLDKFDQGIK